MWMLRVRCLWWWCGSSEARHWCAVLTMYVPCLSVLQDGRQDIINTCLEEYETISVWMVVRDRQGNVASVRFPDEDVLNSL